MHFPKRIIFILLIIVLLTSCGPKLPSLFDINYAYPFPEKGNRDYTIIISPFDPPLPTREQIAIDQNKVEYYAVLEILDNQTQEKSLRVFPLREYTGFDKDKYTLLRQKFFTVFQQVTKPNVVVISIVLDGTYAMRNLCVETANQLREKPLCY